MDNIVKPILNIMNLSIAYKVGDKYAKALNEISFSISAGERIGLIGESGCGKSTLLKTIMGVLPGNAKILAGKIELNGKNLLELDSEARRKTRWADISMITQSALNALNPVQRISDQICEAIRAHENVSYKQAMARVEELFELVGVAKSRAREYPHQFSGGMRQRAIIAMALALSPQLVLADEPTTALDVIVQDQIFTKLKLLQKKMGFAMILVTHDLSLVVENCQKTIVMYGGQMVEFGPTADLALKPLHPYTIGLKNAVPVLGSSKNPISIPGTPPNLLLEQKGCLFAERCPIATEKCRNEIPKLNFASDQHYVRCHHLSEAQEFAEQADNPEIWETNKNIVSV